jgi:hypothetical protein
MTARDRWLFSISCNPFDDGQTGIPIEAIRVGHQGP